MVGRWVREKTNVEVGEFGVVEPVDNHSFRVAVIELCLEVCSHIN